MLLAILALVFPLIVTAQTNVTIDDSSDLIHYTPALRWNIGNDCDYCSSKPDKELAYNGTWHDGTFDVDAGNSLFEAKVSFIGTAVYVYCIVPLYASGPTELTFSIDGEEVGHFNEEPSPGKTGFNYNVPVFSTTGLSLENHTLVIQNGRLDGSDTSLVLLDYIVYSSSDGGASESPASTSTRVSASIEPTSSSTVASSSGTQTNAIVGAVVGSILGLTVILLLIFFWLRTNRRRETAKPIPISPYPRKLAEEFGAYSPMTSPTSGGGAAMTNQSIVTGPFRPLREETTAAMSSSLSPNTMTSPAHLSNSPTHSGGVSSSPELSETTTPSAAAPDISSATTDPQLRAELNNMRQEIQELRAQKARDVLMMELFPPTPPPQYDGNRNRQSSARDAPTG